jgi:hypothetical protein
LKGESEEIEDELINQKNNLKRIKRTHFVSQAFPTDSQSFSELPTAFSNRPPRHLYKFPPSFSDEFLPPVSFNLRVFLMNVSIFLQPIKGSAWVHLEILTLIRLISVLFELTRMIYGRQRQLLVVFSVKLLKFSMVMPLEPLSCPGSSDLTPCAGKPCDGRRQSSCKANTKINGWNTQSSPHLRPVFGF